MLTLQKMLLQCIIFCLLIGISDAAPLECELYQRSFPACKCLKADDSNAGIIDCSGLNLTSLPTVKKSISDTIYEMRLNNNNIVSLTSNSFAGLKIRKLDLRGNRISTVEDGTFQGLAPTTSILYIDGNGTSSPPKGALSKLVNLRELTLINYGTTILLANSGMFIAFENLQKLTLENWRLVSISFDALVGVRSLLSLTLSKQQLAFLPVSLLNSGYLNSLMQLTITNTNIQEVSDYAFQNLNHLQELDLSQNNIHILESLCFEGLADSLKTLNLSGNILSSKAHALQGLRNLPNLKQLDLSDNEFITSVPNLSQLNSYGLKLKLRK